MRRNKDDEYRFDPGLEFGGRAGEYTYAPEYESKCPEYSEPPVFRERAPEFDGDAVIIQKSKAVKSRHEIKKKLLFIPMASVVAVISLLFASMNVDLLGKDFLMASGSSSPATPTTPTTPTARARRSISA